MLLLTIAFSPERGQRRRYRFERATSDDHILRFEETWTGCTWRTEGCEHVSAVSLTEQSEVTVE